MDIICPFPEVFLSALCQLEDESSQQFGGACSLPCHSLAPFVEHQKAAFLVFSSGCREEGQALGVCQPLRLPDTNVLLCVEEACVCSSPFPMDTFIYEVRMVSSELYPAVQEIKSCLSEEAVAAAPGFPSLPLPPPLCPL